MGNSISSAASCISFDSYIKPQLGKGKGKLSAVVYLLIPTSNHNTMSCLINTIVLYIFWFLHQTTTVELFNCRPERCISFDSYIKPQRATRPLYSRFCCISFDSYIKPQLLVHSLHLCLRCISFDSYIKPQPRRTRRRYLLVVYLLIPTSNHNPSRIESGPL